MRGVLVLLLWLCAGFGAWAQSSTVLPEELGLSVEVEDRTATPFVREMVLLTIRGEYRRHITLEKLIQPDFDGFSWAQLGPDSWTEDRIDGKLVKIFERRMAVYPDRPGTLTIGAFTHQLTLTDEGNDWFEHHIQSEPVTVEVAPMPTSGEWWFPTLSLRVSDDWSNAPDLLQPGEGVLRVVRLEALGVTPEMIPPMPELTSPSAIIFPHPEKRLVELTPEGPITYAFWRWTIRPTNDVSTIVEPISFSYFDTRNRETREVEISAQRVAYGSVTPDAPPAERNATSASLPGWPVFLAAGATFVVGLWLALVSREKLGWAALYKFRIFDPLARSLRRAAQRGDAQGARRAAAAILARDGEREGQQHLIGQLDRAIFAPVPKTANIRDIAKRFFETKRIQS